MEAKALKYEDMYRNINEKLGDNPMLVQSFIYSNTPDIAGAIAFWRAEYKDAKDQAEKDHIENMVSRLKNLMEQRVVITEDIFATYMPLMKVGPTAVETKAEPEKEVKVVDHPASKGKKKQKTVNEKLGEEIKSAKAPMSPKTDYDKLYPTDEEKLNALNELLPALEEKLKNGKDKEALRQLKFHLKSYGDKIHFATTDQMNSLLYWLKKGRLPHLSPLNVLKEVPLSIADIVKEADRLVKEKGFNEKTLKKYMKYYIKDNELQEYKDDKIIRTEEEYDSFFQKSMGYLFDEVDERNKSTESNNAPVEKPTEDEETILKNLYEINKELETKSVVKTASDFIEYVKSKGKELTRTDSLTKVIDFIKSYDPKLYKKYMASRTKGDKSNNKSTTEATKGEEQKQSEETIKTDGDTGKKSAIVSPVVYPTLEKNLQFKDRKGLLTEFLITIMNKKLNPIGRQVNGVDKQIEELTLLANKRILELGLKPETDGKGYDDWTEADVAKYMAEEVIPYFTEEYAILKSETKDELKKHLEFYLTKYPAGKEKERMTTLKEVLTSKIPRSNFMKKIARQVSRDKFNDINDIIAEMNTEENEKVKKESES